MKKNTLWGFVIMSFLVQSIIFVGVNIAQGGEMMLDNENAANVIVSSIGLQTEKGTNETLITNDDYEALAKTTNPVEYLWVQFWQTLHWIAKMVVLMTMVLMDYVTISFQILGIAAGIGGVNGSILSIFGLLMLIWQVAMVGAVWGAIKG